MPEVPVLLSLGLSSAGVAQLVEQLIRNQQVVRSIRIAGSSKYLRNNKLLAMLSARILAVTN